MIRSAVQNFVNGRQIRPMSGNEVLAWLNEFGHKVDFQDLSAQVLRAKNRVILQYRDRAGAIKVVGARDLYGAVWKASERSYQHVGSALIK